MRLTPSVLLFVLVVAPFTHAQPQQPRKGDEPKPGTRGNPDNVPYIGKSDPKGNPVRLARATGHVSNYSEDKVSAYVLPDPLVLAGGKKVTTAETWAKERRPEILKFYRTEIYGAVPDNAPKVTWEVTETDDNARKVTAVTRRVVGRMGDKPDGPRMTLTVHTPAKAKGPVPVLLNVTFGFGGAGSAPARRVRPGRGGAGPRVGLRHAQLHRHSARPRRPVERGCDRPDAQGRPDEAGRERVGHDQRVGVGCQPVHRLLRDRQARRWQEGRDHGCFAAGKTVLWAGAQDERVAAVFAAVPGEMGASLVRRDWGETLDDMAQNFHWQFAGNLQKWVGKWNDLPVDQHMLVALCAPRPVFVSGGLTDQWSDPKGQFLALVAAGPVYKLLGAKDLGVTELPPLDKPVASGSLGYHYHSGGHTVLPADWKAFLDFADRHFKGTK